MTGRFFLLVLIGLIGTVLTEKKENKDLEITLSDSKNEKKEASGDLDDQEQSNHPSLLYPSNTAPPRNSGDGPHPPPRSADYQGGSGPPPGGKLRYVILRPAEYRKFQDYKPPPPGGGLDERPRYLLFQQPDSSLNSYERNHPIYEVPIPDNIPSPHHIPSDSRELGPGSSRYPGPPPPPPGPGPYPDSYSDLPPRGIVRYTESHPGPPLPGPKHHSDSHSDIPPPKLDHYSETRPGPPPGSYSEGPSDPLPGSYSGESSGPPPPGSRSYHGFRPGPLPPPGSSSYPGPPFLGPDHFHDPHPGPPPPGPDHYRESRPGPPPPSYYSGSRPDPPPYGPSGPSDRPRSSPPKFESPAPSYFTLDDARSVEDLTPLKKPRKTLARVVVKRPVHRPSSYRNPDKSSEKYDDLPNKNYGPNPPYPRSIAPPLPPSSHDEDSGPRYPSLPPPNSDPDSSDYHSANEDNGRIYAQAIDHHDDAPGSSSSSYNPSSSSSSYNSKSPYSESHSSSQSSYPPDYRPFRGHPDDVPPPPSDYHSEPHIPKLRPDSPPDSNYHPEATISKHHPGPPPDFDFHPEHPSYRHHPEFPPPPPSGYRPEPPPPPPGYRPEPPPHPGYHPEHDTSSRHRPEPLPPPRYIPKPLPPPEFRPDSPHHQPSGPQSDIPIPRYRPLPPPLQSTYHPESRPLKPSPEPQSTRYNPEASLQSIHNDGPSSPEYRHPEASSYNHPNPPPHIHPPGKPPGPEDYPPDSQEHRHRPDHPTPSGPRNYDTDPIPPLEPLPPHSPQAPLVPRRPTGSRPRYTGPKEGRDSERRPRTKNRKPTQQYHEEEEPQKEEKGSNAAIPGEPDKDYPVLSKTPSTDFTCYNKPPGYYADIEHRCQLYYLCGPQGHLQSFLCPNGTIFNQESFVCEWWYNVNCANSEKHYARNNDLYKEPDRTPKNPDDQDRPSQHQKQGGQHQRQRPFGPPNHHAGPQEPIPPPREFGDYPPPQQYGDNFHQSPPNPEYELSPQHLPPPLPRPKIRFPNHQAENNRQYHSDESNRPYHHSEENNRPYHHSEESNRPYQSEENTRPYQHPDASQYRQQNFPSSKEDFRPPREEFRHSQEEFRHSQEDFRPPQDHNDDLYLQQRRRKLYKSRPN